VKEDPDLCQANVVHASILAAVAPGETVNRSETVKPSGPQSTFNEHCTQDRRNVGHDPVDPEVEEMAHLHGIVDGPYVHLQSQAVGMPDKALVYDADT